LFSAVILLLGLVWLAGSASAQDSQRPSIIRDTEIEDTLQEWMAPLLQAAGMGPKSVKIIIVQSPQINAFVAGGANIFIYTGLIEKTENPQEVIGVLAHELGHVAGGHLIAGRQAAQRASYETILGTVLGLGAAIASGEGKIAGAVMSGASNIAARRYLAHSRVQESSADQAGLKFMQTAGVDPSGLMTFLQKLESEELIPVAQQSEYMRTHPITRERIDNVANKIQSVAMASHNSSQDWQDKHARMKAKLMGFINPGRVAWVYDDRDLSIPARYARAIATYRENNAQQALSLMDDLLQQEPKNPYFHELKAQILVDFGRIQEAIPVYRTALRLRPDAALIRSALAHALLESGSTDAAPLNEAVNLLQRVAQEDQNSPQTHRLLATAYGRLGDENAAQIHLAQEAFLMGKYEQAKRMAKEILTKVKTGPLATRAQDILDQSNIAERDSQ